MGAPTGPALVLATITGELPSGDPNAAIDRLVRFLTTADRVFEGRLARRLS
jgi:hypothetical protein